MIAIETAGPERLTFVHQIDTVEPSYGRTAPQFGGTEGKKCHTFGYIGYLSPKIAHRSDGQQHVGSEYRYIPHFSILYDASLPSERES